MKKTIKLTITMEYEDTPSGINALSVMSDMEHTPGAPELSSPSGALSSKGAQLTMMTLANGIIASILDYHIRFRTPQNSILLSLVRIINQGLKKASIIEHGQQLSKN